MRVRSLAKPYRDPMIDDVKIVVDQMKREANGIPGDIPVNVDQALRALVVDALREPCLICDGKPDLVQIYHVPEGLNRAGQKVVFYSLCYVCKMDVTTRDMIEGRLVKQLQAENERLAPT